VYYRLDWRIHSKLSAKIQHERKFKEYLGHEENHQNSYIGIRLDEVIIGTRLDEVIIQITLICIRSKADIGTLEIVPLVLGMY